MQCLFFVMEVHQAFSDLLHDFSALIWVKFANKVGKTSVGTVLEDDDQELFLFVKEELSGFQDVGVIKKDVHLGFFFSTSFVFLGDGNDFEGVLVFIDGFDKVNFTKAPSAKKF
jgi:hypothetical protein